MLFWLQVKTNPFVNNLANALNINPSRIRVVNIVPGNNRRRRLNHDDPQLSGTKRRSLLEDDDDDSGLTVKWELSEEGPTISEDVPSSSPSTDVG